MNIRLFFLLSWLLFLSLQSFSQARPAANNTMYRVQTEDDKVYFGYILNQKPEYLILTRENAETLVIQIAHIVKLERVNDSTKEQSSRNFTRPQETTYHFAPTGYGLPEGEGYYQNSYLFINQFYVGVTDYFSLGGGTVPLPLDGVPVWLAPKFSLPILADKLNVGLGSLNGYTLGITSAAFGIFYGNLTFGSRTRNFSIGAGKAYNDGFNNRAFALAVSGMFQASEEAYILTENYRIDQIIMGTFGGRQVWANISIDYSLLYIHEYKLRAVMPYIGIMVPFGHKG